MNLGNESAPKIFILLGFSNYPWLEMPLFIMVLVAYVCTVVGNISIIVVSKIDPQLDSPMYFFLSNLSFLDLCFTTTTIPQLLRNLWGPDKSISYRGCVTQFYIFHFLGATECILLAVMSLDRYIAICKPLRYPAIMHQQFCILLMFMTWLSGLANSLLQSTLTVKLPFCGNNKVDNFLCEVPVMIKMSCANTAFNIAMLSIVGTFYSLVPLSLILVSYGFIVATVLRIRSSEGKKKAFNTCGSHVVVVTLFYGPVISMYVQPSSSSSQDKNKLLSLFYSLVTPMLNPFIYTLRNKDVKGAMRRFLVSLFHKESEQT
ncbi:olfactory receptor 1664 (predicted) [Rattus norvegicus]|uniref:Olfactory receptor n=2 Tax=Rattus norvegicus TaxID=10116 RepID=A6KN61_RAT|nr:olfactory receptor Olr1664 [Rattus norvegicus]EDL84529.1 olfactory receptor 1664 (predicted) [Rattus norvegicus]|eukprot:NP_001001007.1 olfactory receptor Olr1664 [Rattus norvegicus]